LSFEKGNEGICGTARYPESIPGVTLKEMAKPDACCGSGGSYTITHLETSMEITGRKMADIKKTGCGMVITGCPGCMMQLSEGLTKSGQEQVATTTYHFWPDHTVKVAYEDLGREAIMRLEGFWMPLIVNDAKGRDLCDDKS